MYRTTFQSNIFPIFNAGGLDPLSRWRVQKRDGYIKRVYEPETGILIMEMMALNTTLHYITTPKDPKNTLGLRMPILNFLIRNLNKCFSFEIKIMDDSRTRRRFRCGNYIRCSSIQYFETTIPLSMAGNDWVLIYFNIAEFTRRCYNTSYVETERVQINGNIHLRHVFFSDRVIEYGELPKEYQLFYSDKKKEGKRKEPPARPPSAQSKGKPGNQQKRTSLFKSTSVSSIDVNASHLEGEMPGSPKSDMNETVPGAEGGADEGTDAIPIPENATTDDSPVMIAGSEPVGEAEEVEASEPAAQGEE